MGIVDCVACNAIEVCVVCYEVVVKEAVFVQCVMFSVFPVC